MRLAYGIRPQIDVLRQVVQARAERQGRQPLQSQQFGVKQTLLREGSDVIVKSVVWCDFSWRTCVPLALPVSDDEIRSTTDQM
jgi:hypothetical protein